MQHRAERPTATTQLLVALLISGAVFVLVARDLPYRSYDSSYYLRLATEGPEQVIAPFSGRILHAGLAGMLSQQAGLSIDAAFLLLAGLALFVFVGVIVRLLALETGYVLASIPLLFTPFLLRTFREVYLPDLFHAALLASFFWIARRNPAVSSLLLLPLLLARETSVLLAVVLVALALARRELALCGTVILVTAVALACRHAAVGESPGNIHTLGEPVYLALKLPFNFMRNIMGLEFWANTIDYCRPLYRLELPARLQLGGVQAVGCCGFNLFPVLNTSRVLLTVFGVAPTVLVALLPVLRTWRPYSPSWLLSAAGYGALAFALGTSTGADVERLTGFGWPISLLATPIWLGRVVRQVTCMQLLLLHVAAAWIPWFGDPFGEAWLITNAAMLSCAVPLHIMAWRLTRRALSVRARPALQVTPRQL